MIMTRYPVNTDRQLSQLLAGFRKAKGWTQADLASRMGVSQQLISAMERDVTSTTAARLLTALRVLGVRMVLTTESGRSTDEGKTPAPKSTEDW
jgi:HTH-type transcriptional regulator/antitoxin HipB